MITSGFITAGLFTKNAYLFWHNQRRVQTFVAIEKVCEMCLSACFCVVSIVLSMHYNINLTITATCRHENVPEATTYSAGSKVDIEVKTLRAQTNEWLLFSQLPALCVRSPVYFCPCLCQIGKGECHFIALSSETPMVMHAVKREKCQILWMGPFRSVECTPLEFKNFLKCSSEFRIRGCWMDPLKLTSGGNLGKSTFPCTV